MAEIFGNISIAPAFSTNLRFQFPDAGFHLNHCHPASLQSIYFICIRELESEVEAENRCNGDVFKNHRRSERPIKELTFAADEDKKNHERMQALIDQLQGKVKSYKKQIEEAEEIAALNLAKFRKGQSDLEQAEERADINEQVLAKYKAKGRGTSLGLV